MITISFLVAAFFLIAAFGVGLNVGIRAERRGALKATRDGNPR